MAMTDGLFIRIRGKVRGPYTEDQLRRLVKRGQFGRMHEVSEDGSTWKRATSFPQLFPSPSATNDDVAADHELPSLEPVDDLATYPADNITDSPAASEATETGWYYRREDQQYGPVDRTYLQNQLDSGVIAATEIVWREGMPDWAPAHSVPGLVKTQQPRSSPDPFAQTASGIETSHGTTGDRASCFVPEIVCPHCHCAIRRDDPWVEDVVNCPQCGGFVQVPSSLISPASTHARSWQRQTRTNYLVVIIVVVAVYVALVIFGVLYLVLSRYASTLPPAGACVRIADASTSAPTGRCTTRSSCRPHACKSFFHPGSISATAVTKGDVRRKRNRSHPG